MPTAPGSALAHLARAALRGMIGRGLGRAAPGVLLAREISMADGRRKRWLRADLARFRAALPGAAAALRPQARLGELNRFGNRLMVECAVWTIAAYRVLLDMGVVPAEARALVADIGWRVYAPMLRLVSLPPRIVTRDPGRRLRWTIRALLVFPFSAPGAPGYAVETRIEGDDILTHFTHCPPQSFVRRLVASGDRGGDKGGDDRGDLEAFRASWCGYDRPGADVIAADSRRGHYQRHQALSHGDPVCDMCWIARARTVEEPRTDERL